MSNDQAVAPSGGDTSRAERVYFEAVLTPHRSLSRWGFTIMMAAVCAITMGLGLFFLLRGAWPVLGFFGLDVALLYFAFRVNYRAGRIEETVRITDTRLEIGRRSPNGAHASWTFNPYWARLSLAENGMDGGRITLSSHGRSVTIGSFLSPDERRAFGTTLDAALRRANGRGA